MRPGESSDSARYPQTILAACCLPWDADGSLEEAIFRDAVGRLVGAGLRDLYVFGTAGEGYAVDERLFDQVVQVFTDETDRLDVSPMVGIINLSLRTVVERIERCMARGVRLFQISLPAWGALNDAELRTFFAHTCGRFPEAGFLHYNVARAGRLVTSEEYAELADRHPNLVAIKHTAVDADSAHALFEQVGSVRHFFTESAYGDASLIGPCGFLVSIASVSPRLAHDYFDAGVSGDVETLTALRGELKGMSVELKRLVDNSVHMDGAFDKVFNKLHDPRFPLRLLPPYEGASEEAFDRFSRALRERFPRWYDGSGSGRVLADPAAVGEEWP